MATKKQNSRLKCHLENSVPGLFLSSLAAKLEMVGEEGVLEYCFRYKIL